MFSPGNPNITSASTTGLLFNQTKWISNYRKVDYVLTSWFDSVPFFKEIFTGHVKIFIVMFGLVGVMLLAVLTSSSSLPKHYYMMLIISITFTMTRAAVFFADAYGAENLMAPHILRICWTLDFPSIISCLVIMLVVLRRLTKQHANTTPYLMVSDDILFCNMTWQSSSPQISGIQFIYTLIFASKWKPIMRHDKFLALASLFSVIWGIYINFHLFLTSFNAYRKLCHPPIPGSSLHSSINAENNRIRLDYVKASSSSSSSAPLKVYYVNGPKPKIRIVDENEQSFSYHSDTSSLQPPTSKTGKNISWLNMSDNV